MKNDFQIMLRRYF